MLATVPSATLVGLAGRVIRVEVDVAPGLPGFTIVGLADAALQEARERVRGALRKPIDHQIVNEYRGAISALNSGAPFMFTKSDSALGGSLLHFARAVDKPATAEAKVAIPSRAQ